LQKNPATHKILLGGLKGGFGEWNNWEGGDLQTFGRIWTSSYSLNLRGRMNSYSKLRRSQLQLQQWYLAATRLRTQLSARSYDYSRLQKRRVAAESGSLPHCTGRS
jgi:hypothetical protein